MDRAEFTEGKEDHRLTPKYCTAVNAKLFWKKIKCNELEVKLQSVCEHLDPGNLHHFILNLTCLGGTRDLRSLGHKGVFLDDSEGSICRRGRPRNAGYCAQGGSWGLGGKRRMLVPIPRGGTQALGFHAPISESSQGTGD